MYSKCQKCGKKLTDPESIERGYGPECWGSILPHYSIEQEEPEESIPGQMTIEDFLGGLKLQSTWADEHRGFFGYGRWGQWR